MYMLQQWTVGSGSCPSSFTTQPKTASVLHYVPYIYAQLDLAPLPSPPNQSVSLYFGAPLPSPPNQLVPRYVSGITCPIHHIQVHTPPNPSHSHPLFFVHHLYRPVAVPPEGQAAALVPSKNDYPFVMAITSFDSILPTLRLATRRQRASLAQKEQINAVPNAIFCDEPPIGLTFQ